MSGDAINCPGCGAKIRADRRRCPRCRAVLAPTDPRAAAATSRRLKIAAGAVVGVFGLALAVLWVAREWREVPQPALPVAAVSRPAPRPEASPAPAPLAELERPFLDARGRAAIAYGAGDMEAALVQYEEAIRRNPNDAESLSNLGQVLVRLNRTAEALPYFDRAIALIPYRWAYSFNRARTLGLLGRWEECVAEYRRAQALFPNDYVTTFNLALALRKLGDNEGAIAALHQAIALEPNDASFRVALGMTYERLQKPTDAASAYEEALKLAPLAPDADVVRRRIAQLRGTTSGE